MYTSKTKTKKTVKRRKRRKKINLWTKENIEKALIDIRNVIENDDEIVWLGTVTSQLGIGKQRVSEWIHKYPEFATLLNESKEILEARLVAGAATGKFSAPFVKFVLVNHGVSTWLSEKVQSDINHQGDAQFNVNLKIDSKDSSEIDV